MRRALGASPVFSHRRNSAVPIPQNVNVVLSASDPDAGTAPRTQSIPVSMSEVRPPTFGRISQAIPAGKPPQMVVNTRPVVSENRERIRVIPDVNDRFLNKNADVMASQDNFGNPLECNFEIPSFLMPDPDPSVLNTNQRCPSFLLPGPSINPSLITLLVEHWTGVNQGNNQELDRVKNQISQIEFEQKCLVPALRAHVLGGSACRSRELTVYLEWLLYLRQKLFHI